jgi:hypothetical protein
MVALKWGMNVRLLDGRSFPISTFGLNECKRINQQGRGSGARALQNSYSRIGGYSIPGGVIVGYGRGPGAHSGSPRWAYMNNKDVVVLFSPDPTGRTTGRFNAQRGTVDASRRSGQCSIGRGYFLTKAGAKWLAEAAGKSGPVGNYPSSRMWLEQWFGPELMKEAVSMAKKEKKGEKMLEDTAQQEGESSGTAGPGGLPTPLIIGGAAIAGYYFLSKQKKRT